MSLWRRIYYNTIVGAIGGLIGWFVIGTVLNIAVAESASGLSLELILRDALWGSTIGLLIGLLVGLVEGIASGGLFRIVVGAGSGTLLGLIGGAVGLIFAEIVFQLIGGGILARSLGWAILGFLVGLGEGITTASPRKISYGLVGGTLGGFVGGLVFEIMTRFFAAQSLSRAFGLMLIGALIGSLIGLVEEVLRRAWLKVLLGNDEGKEFTLTKRNTRVGRDERCEVCLRGDKQVSPQHVEIRQEQKQFVLHLVPGTEPVWVNRQPTNDPVALEDNARIQIGQTVLLFRSRIKHENAGQGG